MWTEDIIKSCWCCCHHRWRHHSWSSWNSASQAQYVSAFLPVNLSPQERLRGEVAVFLSTGLWEPTEPEFSEPTDIKNKILSIILKYVGERPLKNAEARYEERRWSNCGQPQPVIWVFFLYEDQSTISLTMRTTSVYGRLEIPPVLILGSRCWLELLPKADIFEDLFFAQHDAVVALLPVSLRYFRCLFDSHYLHHTGNTINMVANSKKGEPIVVCCAWLNLKLVRIF